MSVYVIEKHIPVPTARRRGTIYPWNNMEVGDSFFVPNRDPQSFKNISRKYGKRFSARNWQEGTVKGSRIWRTA
jgi:hypothetical protein